MITNLLMFVLGCFLLIVGSIYLIKSITKIGSFIKLSGFVIGFFVLALGNSLPELFIGINSAMAKSSVVSLGNVIGSNIVNLTLILGITSLVCGGIKTKNKTISRDGWIMFFMLLLPILLIGIDGVLGRIDGVILISIFLVYTYSLFKKGKLKSESREKVSTKEFSSSFFIAIISFGLMFFGSSLAVEYAQVLSFELEIPPLIIGLVILGMGTALPEIASTMKAVKSGQGDLAVGDVMGSVAINATLVLGVAALIFPIAVDFLLFAISAAFLLVICFLFITLIGKGGLTRKEAAALILFHIFFVIVEFYLGTRGV